MNITLEEWLAIDAQAKIAYEALHKLAEVLETIHLAHTRDSMVVGFVKAVEDRLEDAQNITGSLKLQSEWLGGDSSLAENHGLREPNAVSIVRAVPHLIDGSRDI